MNSENNDNLNKKKSNIKHLGSSALLAILLALTPMNNNTKAQEISNNFTNTKTTSIFTKTEKAPDSTYQQLNIENFTSTKNTQEEKSALSNELSLYKLENSYLGYVGKFSEPMFAPLGFDWRMTVALETGLAAKEVVVSTLSILYGLGEENDESSTSLIEKIRNNIPFASAIAFKF